MRVLGECISIDGVAWLGTLYAEICYLDVFVSRWCERDIKYV